MRQKRKSAIDDSPAKRKALIKPGAGKSGDGRRGNLRSISEARDLSIRLLPMVDQIAQALTEEIARGVYKSGDRLREQELALRFQVSRGPIRESLRLLEADGLVQILPWRGAVIAARSATEMNENAEVRAALFELAASHAAANASLEQIARIKEAAGKLRALADDPEKIMDYKEQSSRTGRLVVEASGNNLLGATLESLARRTLRHYSYLGLSTPERRRRSSELWTILAAAIAARNGKRAASAARKLVEESQQHAMAAMREMEARDADQNLQRAISNSR